MVENTKNIKFIELEAAQLARVLDDVHAAAVNTNYALQAGAAENPMDSLVRERVNPATFARSWCVVRTLTNPGSSSWWRRSVP